METRKVAIIGSGPAGLTAAIYTARAGLEPIVFEGIQPGGQLTITTDIENYPGFPEGIAGPELMDQMRKQAERFGSKHVFDEVGKVDLTSRPFRLWTSDIEVHAHTVIIATGASARWLGIPTEEAYMGRGVSACATCDGFFFKNMEVAVVGGGDTAMEEATFLTRFASRVHVIHRRDQLRASNIMQARAKANPKINFIWNSTIEEIFGENVVEGVKLRNLLTGELSTLPLGGVFMAIGHVPNTKPFVGQIDLHANGYIKLHGHTQTSVEGVFAAGDVADQHYRQAISAAGTGCMAALDAQHYLEALGF